jgi:hypothetical protein
MAATFLYFVHYMPRELTRDSSCEKAASGVMRARGMGRVGFNEVESLGLRVERKKN